MVAKSMVIVESPAKAKTINKFLGSSYFVRSSIGHIRDLPSKNLGVDTENGFTPTYRIIPARKEIVTKLRKEIKKVDYVYLASDRDREGEAIAWHLCEALKIPEEKIQRVTFNEITKDAISKAFKEPGPINMDKVNAQQARRILDRLVGYKISPLLWKKITKRLSAGRVQSVAVRLIVEREKEISVFNSQEYWEFTADLASKLSKTKEPVQDTKDPKQGPSVGNVLVAELTKIDGKPKEISNEKEANTLEEDLKDATYTVTNITKRKSLNKASSPFSTSLLQQQASIKLRFSTKKTMLLAQQLYEGVELGAEGSVGLITYMRTDSLSVSEQAIPPCRDVIEKTFGKEYLPTKPNIYKSKKGAQLGHEAIRPTYAERNPESLQPFLTADQHKLYKLIWDRFIASQMKPAQYAITEIEIEANPTKSGGKRCLFKARGRETIFQGHTVLTYSDSERDKQEQEIPSLTKDEILDLVKLTPSQHFTQPPPRFSEATLVKMLEKNGIGRPSTYAAIISNIQDRGYVTQTKRLFHPTDLGTLVTEKLVKHFPKILDVKFTSQMEDKLDKIEEIHEDWLKVLKEFYESFSSDLEKAKVEMGSVKESPEESKYSCQLCNKPMVTRWSRIGKFLGCSGFPDCKNTIAIDENGEPVKQEKSGQLCEKCGKEMVVKFSRNAKFLACSGYPECKNTKSLNGDNAVEFKAQETDEKCEKCDGMMLIRSSRMGKFLGCSNYPKCKNTKAIPTEVKCPKEGCDGNLVQKRGKRRMWFFGCTKYPECDFTAKDLNSINEES
ncbi:MAG: type I DNA topoisomerase [Candidatus Scalindua sp. AMX11]|nr:MAG: type I DNA topoisomerase [Candidatus Scalindua sp.]NOG84884.1 type I DNA topoisomerase [Planctomycetota bacterium]RZV84952.1 MAG: type I DNA topoisomerase [Candidatus Scalindua sp. SCAELEC01]TDE65055.1 MAG: type I DNA topoisomerase [Candidatus Scalindua sp. AMX11]GJQ59447.1 MAG: DNA topoisomerase 1 [Candidatus Scalindua sp.]